MKKIIISLYLILPFIVSAKGALEGYSNYETFRKEVYKIGENKGFKTQAIGKTLSGREIILITAGIGKLDLKPAFFIVGNINPARIADSAIVKGMMQLFVNKFKEKSIQELLKHYTFYFIPRPNPDATEAFFHKPFQERKVNNRKTDNDRDGRLNEDPNEDLNKDGFITMMRVEDVDGEYIELPTDRRILVKADLEKGEKGKYKIFSEGIDNDKDELFNEDGIGGVDFNQNFTFRYPYFKVAAGAYQMSENETRALADFAFSHPNIAIVMSFSDEDNLRFPWKVDLTEKKKCIKTAVLSKDSPYFEKASRLFKEIFPSQSNAKSIKGQGSFSEWAYYHFGRWSFSARSWHFPSAENAKKSKENTVKSDKSEKKIEVSSTENKQSQLTDNRGSFELNILKYFDAEKIDGFVDWQVIKHPDFPNQKVEIGGIKPFFSLNPKFKNIADITKKHLDFLIRLSQMMPRIEIAKPELVSLGEGMYRLKIKIYNRGKFPTMPVMGEHFQNKLQVKLELPKGVTLYENVQRKALPRLAANVGMVEKKWILISDKKKNYTIKINVYSPSIGLFSTEAKLE